MLCRRVIMAASLVVVLGLVGKASAAPVAYRWTNNGGDALWRNPLNWTPNTGWPGENDGNDTADLEEVLRGPIIGAGTPITVASISGPDPCDTGAATVDIETGATLTVKGNWTLDQGSTGTTTINISGTADVNILGSVRSHDDGTTNWNITGTPNIHIHGRLKGGDNGDAIFELYMDGGYLKAGQLDLDEGGYSPCTIVGGTMIVDAGIEMPWGEFTLDGDANVAMNGGFSCREDAEDGAPNSVASLNSGRLFCTGFGPDGNDWNLDIDEGVTWIIKGAEHKEMLEAHIDAGRITGKDNTESPVVVEYLSDGSIWYPEYLGGGETYTQVGFDLVQENAYSPHPRRGSVDLCPNSVTISWTPGMYCVDDHNVYFGTSWDDVNESTTPYEEHYESNSVTVTNLQVGKTYYWRVDEVNDSCDTSPWKGSVWHFSTEGPVASDPSPAHNRRGLKAEDVDSLSWSSHCIAGAHNLYFATDLPASIVLFDDDFETGAFDPNWTASGSWEVFDANGDPNFDGRDANMAKATGSGNLITANIDATNGDPCAMNISFYFRKTEEITNGEIKLYYYDGSSWDYIADLNSNPEGVNDVWLHYSDTNSDSQYFVNNFKIKLEANIISGGTVYIDDVTVTNTWPTSAQWLEARVAGTTTTYPISVDPMTVYRWRVDAVVDGNVYQGPHWKFSTGYRGLLMYYRFDGTNPFPSPIQDDSDNDIEFYTYIDPCGGSVTYGESNPVYAGSTASADFEPNAGLWRDDPCGPSEDTRDILRLDGDYTVEMWVMPRSLSEEENAQIWLISKRDSWGLRIQGDNDLNFWYQWPWGNTDKGSVEVGEWHHIAVIYDQEDEDLSLRGIYLDGEREGDGGGLLPPDNNSPIWIGCRVLADGNLGNFFDGMIDELRIHDIALRPCELLVFKVGPEYASCPTPYDGEGEIDPCTVELIWTPGEGAVDHDIYFSSNYSAVVGGSPVETGWGPSSWTPTTLPLRDGTVYYWRIDTYDNGGPPYEGDVWKFTTKYVIEDANLLLHYKLDETVGDDAIDASGHGHHGDVDEDDKWDPEGGHDGGCLIFENDQTIDVPSEATSAITDKISISVWLYGFDLYAYERDGDDNWVLQIGDGDYFVDVIVPDENGDVYWRAGNDSNDTLVWNDATPSGWEGDWHFFAFVKDESANLMKIYFDGLEVKSKDEGTSSSLSNVAGEAFNIGAEVDDDDSYTGKMDDLRVFGKALSAKEVGALFRGGDIERAWGPNPYDGQPDAPYHSDLIWRPGDYADLHDVYFGTNWGEVNDANASIHPNVDYVQLDVNTHGLDVLDLDEWYYWRVDEVNDACDPNGWKGYVWRFKVADYITIDDMEDYTETKDYPIAKKSGATTWGWDDIYVNWTNAIVGLLYPGWSAYPEIEAHGGDQAMYYIYDSSADPWYSEISNHFTLDPNDWTIANVKMIALWFRGMPGNDADESMYMGLEDEDGAASYAQVNYGDQGEDTNDIKSTEWQVWRIPLSDFTDDNPSLELEKMQKLYIGFGDRGNPAPGGAGEVFFDNIRLYQPICVPSKRSSEFAKLDFDEDCIVGFGDVEFMSAEWLESDINLGEVTNPSDTNLVGWWNFDENNGDGNLVTDSSGNGHDGVIETNTVNVEWVVGRGDVNYALEFTGGRVLVPDSAELRPLHQVSAAAWINYSEAQDTARIVVKGPDNRECYAIEIGGEDGLSFYVGDGNDPNALEYERYFAESDDDVIDRDEWVHVAGTYDGNSVKAYVNGELVAENNDANSDVIPFLSQDTNDLAIGNRSDATNRAFEGIIDDVRVYDRGLTAAEIGYLASDGTGIVVEESIANLIDGEALGERAVNMRDFAVLADEWLKREFWP